MRLLGPTETAIPPFSKLIAAGLPLSTLVWTPTMLLAQFARTAKLVLERIELFVMDAILAINCTLTPPALKADGRIIDEGMAGVRAARQIDAVPGEMPDRAADDVDLFAGGNAHVIKARPKSLDVEPFKFLDRFT